jgi:hypothetical protein
MVLQGETMVAKSYSPVNEPLTNEELDCAFANLERADRIRVSRAINDITGIARNFGAVSAKEFIAKLGTYMLARDEFGPDATLASRNTMKKLREKYSKP